jgi:hypothetical protein
MTHPYGTLISEGIAVGIELAVLFGMFFFQRCERLVFVVFVAVSRFAFEAFRVHRYSLSSSPSFVAAVGVLILLSTVAIVGMSFLPPVRNCFATKEAKPCDGANGWQLWIKAEG